MLEAGELTTTQQRKAFEVIDRNLAAQAQLIDDLLNVSRIVTGKLILELQPAYPAPIIEEAIDSIGPTVKAKSLKLTQDLDTGLGPMQIDPPRFHQIVWNLLTNAVKFTPKKGHIHVSLKRINSNALLQFSDSGEGIDPEFLPYIFERFRQADASRSRKYGGLGVGLSIAKSLVEQHGGTIYAESAGAGKGSTFNVTLPIPGLSAHSVSSSKQTTPTESILKGARILVVEDEPDTRDMIAHAIKQRGAKPVKVDSARKALELLQKEPCDLVISDIGMPDLDGYAFIRKIRSLKSPIATVPV
jgi:CheY-like chemotaxis protein